MYETTANLASLNNRQHVCSALADEFFTKSQTKAAQAASSRYESGKPVIITDFSMPATRKLPELTRNAELRPAEMACLLEKGFQIKPRILLFTVEETIFSWMKAKLPRTGWDFAE